MGFFALASANPYQYVTKEKTQNGCRIEQSGSATSENSDKVILRMVGQFVSLIKTPTD